VVFCLPDFEPVFDLVVEGLRNAGNLIDNWMDVTMVIIQSVLTGTSPVCDVGMAVIDVASKSALMGLNETTIVGIATSAFALTDGWNIQVFERAETHNYPGAFPMPVRVSYGIAKVSATVDIPGLMGCVCSNQAYWMQIVCAVAPLDPLESSYYVPVEFAVPTTSFYMGCGRSKIKLDSMRWPATRHTSPNSCAVKAPAATESSRSTVPSGVRAADSPIRDSPRSTASACTCATVTSDPTTAATTSNAPVNGDASPSTVTSAAPPKGRPATAESRDRSPIRATAEPETVSAVSNPSTTARPSSP
jgi:hypothetical protein